MLIVRILIAIFLLWLQHATGAATGKPAQPVRPGSNVLDSVANQAEKTGYPKTVDDLRDVFRRLSRVGLLSDAQQSAIAEQWPDTRLPDDLLTAEDLTALRAIGELD